MILNCLVLTTTPSPSLTCEFGRDLGLPRRSGFENRDSTSPCGKLQWWILIRRGITYQGLHSMRPFTGEMLNVYQNSLLSKARSRHSGVRGSALTAFSAISSLTQKACLFECVSASEPHADARSHQSYLFLCEAYYTVRARNFPYTLMSVNSHL